MLAFMVKVVLNACFYGYFVVYFDHALYARAWIDRSKTAA